MDDKDAEDEMIDEELIGAERRAALDARDRSLLTRFLARDKEAEREVVSRLNSMGRLVARRYWLRLYFEWEDFRGEYFALLHRWREEGKLRVDESLRFLAQRLMKQSGRKAGVEAHRDQMALSLQGKSAPHAEEDAVGPKPGAAEDAKSWAEWLERQATASIAAQPRFASPETAVSTQQQLQWLTEAMAKLTPADRATLAAERAVAEGEHESLAKALGVGEEAAWQRRSRLKKALRRIAEETGATDILERLEARMQRRQPK